MVKPEHIDTAWLIYYVLEMYDVITRKLINVWAWFAVFWNPYVKLHNISGTKTSKGEKTV